MGPGSVTSLVLIIHSAFHIIIVECPELSKEPQVQLHHNAVINDLSVWLYIHVSVVLVNYN